MHGVERWPEPDFFDAIRCRYDEWDELYDVAGERVRNCRNRKPSPCCTAHLQGQDGEGIRQAIRNALRSNFAGICGYCEQDCASLVTVIEHFRPRSLFPDEWIAWDNLIYACQRCDFQKEEKWPGPPGDYDESYSYVSPNLVLGKQPAEAFFQYYLGFEEDAEVAGNSDGLVPGQMVPSSNLSPGNWWRAYRTIEDLDLNSDSNDNASGDERLPYVRNVYLETLIIGIESDLGDLYSNIDGARYLLQELSQPDQPFSSYVAAFARSLGLQVR